MKKVIELPRIILVRDLAEKLLISATDLISSLAKNGLMISITESIDYETAEIIADEFEIKVKPTSEKMHNFKTQSGQKRPPIVAVMGHVDHGKTKVLDVIKSTDIVSKESGGITQHIGAYQVKYKKDLITFLDTPGHEAFTKLRAYGANVTDIIVLVVSATEGVKPQTLEAISLAKSSKSPVIVAINKIDLPGSDPESVKRQLSGYGLVSKDWGGDTEIIEISALKKININQLLDKIIEVSKSLELKADKNEIVSGYVVESHIETGYGPVATVIIMQGILKKNDYLYFGNTWAKVKNLINWRNENIDTVEPASPVKITGLKKIVEIGSHFHFAKNEKEARKKIEKKQEITSYKSIADSAELKTFPIILKADTTGSIFTIIDHIKNLDAQDYKIKIVSSRVGNVTESDINTALASKALIFCFKTVQSQQTTKLAEQNSIEIYYFDVIYQLFDKINELINKLLEDNLVEEVIGKFEVLKDFFQTNESAVLGGKLIQGKMLIDVYARVIRDESLIGKVKVNNLKSNTTDVNEINEKGEYGIKVYKTKISDKIRVGDSLELYIINKVIKKVHKIN
ncbi:translation initiation factor IF-2 [Candidatus Berkelbacteria bacterium CG_4_8_14_3_um_filter_33_6]|uniref:Translation initiation factor IF-2 n=1 Tax=Candidatus Berkelbacteria bacterium CG_4_10_14_0_2_um_filter_35_9_33_12 TaxID=1974499 RepID=A0A2M7W5D2_9BACT|nr:MAG: translation initiation factor IF-2 [Candidatus Berkelbacteria bacterium CG23_combo_of_CG06-09_8_20_14_all_33_15]PIS08139.1 MAG: translation initiation factor IF-2 [Candidatus Berkelbacteria bacterium CG10_big_fil_rev_8_21_14_0_10_33_10]PIX30935.1 MAG: translation initiation factor IF-2 [Candidatus Berkelbacteria bacterium CG_4_8_14_3_um_filter_33_6]PIZ27897.1 MAG: translation initiation factor IF-2 [Candidatus Berkelbacteria bacterium CG_4_10_14_0_8_um_filter_35_9_33_8]PJA20744.1 MAG: t